MVNSSSNASAWRRIAALFGRLADEFGGAADRSEKCASGNEGEVSAGKKAETEIDTPNIGSLKLKTRKTWGDYFPGDGPADRDKWRFEPMEDGMHQVGNVFDGVAIKGMRHAGIYGELTDTLAFRRANKLVMKVFAEDAPNPYRKNVIGPDDFVHRYGDYRLHVPWLDTSHLGLSDLFDPNKVYECRISFERMSVPGARVSWWFMPAFDQYGNDAKSDAYDEDAANGVECDGFEYDVGQPHLLQCKHIGGKAGQTPDGGIDLRQFDIDLTTGYHDITIVRADWGTVWLVDGIEILRDEKIIPLSTDYMILSMEVNSGAKPNPQPHELKSEPPLLPNDPGLYAKSVIRNVHLIDKHEAHIKHICVYDII